MTDFLRFNPVLGTWALVEAFIKESRPDEPSNPLVWVQPFPVKGMECVQHPPMSLLPGLIIQTHSVTLQELLGRGLNS